jgi:hypothetical protein
MSSADVTIEGMGSGARRTVGATVVSLLVVTQVGWLAVLAYLVLRVAS